MELSQTKTANKTKGRHMPLSSYEGDPISSTDDMAAEGDYQWQLEDYAMALEAQLNSQQPVPPRPKPRPTVPPRPTPRPHPAPPPDVDVWS